MSSCRTRKDGLKIQCLARIAKYIKYLDITWPCLYNSTQNKRDECRPTDRENAKSTEIFFQALSTNSCLEYINIKFENKASMDKTFCDNLLRSLGTVVKKCSNICFLSLGYHPMIRVGKIPFGKSVEKENILRDVQEFHVAWPRQKYLTQLGAGVSDQLDPDSNILGISSLNKVHSISINWTDLGPNVIESLCGRPQYCAQIQKLVLYFEKHHICCHPSRQQWAKFVELNNCVKISAVFVEDVNGVCPAASYIPNVIMVKFLECSTIDEDQFSNIMSLHKDTIESHVYVNTKGSVELHNGDDLFNISVICQNLQFVTIIGFYIGSEDLELVGSAFPKLKEIVVSKTHILTSASATNYLVPISGSKYVQLKTSISENILGKPWEALTRLPLKTLYYADSKDDELYLTGKLSTLK